MSSLDPIAAEKQLLRARALAARRALDLRSRTQASAAICRSLAALAELAGDRPVAAFAPMNEEVDIRPLLEKWTCAGRSVILPRVVRGTTKMTWHKICDFNRDLDTGYAGVPEPKSEIPEFDPAAIRAALIPSVAVDQRGNRIGFGGGFYDTNSPRFDGVFVITPVFSCQLIAACPTQAHDQRIDTIVTEREVVRCQ